METMDDFVTALSRAEIGATINQYACYKPGLDRPHGAAIRAANLRAYLEGRRRPVLLLVGEAPSYRGCRFSGIPFTSERSLPPEAWSSTNLRGWQEASATIVHRTLKELQLEGVTLLWNACPFHPPGSSLLTNRTPTADELAEGLVWFDRLVTLAAPTHVAAVGQSAASQLAGVRLLRHPAHGGARKFREDLVALARELRLRPTE